MKQIECEWLDYKIRVLPPGASDIQIRETRKAFYAGVRCLSTILLDLCDNKEPDLKVMADIEQELNDFAAGVAQGVY